MSRKKRHPWSDRAVIFCRIAAIVSIGACLTELVIAVWHTFADKRDFLLANENFGRAIRAAMFAAITRGYIVTAEWIRKMGSK